MRKQSRVIDENSKKELSERGFDPLTCGLWAHHSSTELLRTSQMEDCVSDLTRTVDALDHFLHYLICISAAHPALLQKNRRLLTCLDKLAYTDVNQLDGILGLDVVVYKEGIKGDHITAAVKRTVFQSNLRTFQHCNADGRCLRVW